MNITLEGLEVYPHFIHECGGKLVNLGMGSDPSGNFWFVFLCDRTEGGCGKKVRGPTYDAGPEDYWYWASHRDDIRIIGCSVFWRQDKILTLGRSD